MTNAGPASAWRLRRGGNTFVPDPETVRLAPNPALATGRRPGRRSDRMRALLQRRYFGKKAVAAPVAVYHDRSRAPAGAPDVERMVDDTCSARRASWRSERPVSSRRPPLPT